MPQDAYTLNFLCKELNSVFSGGKINKIIQPDNDRVILTVYNGKETERLLISVDPSLPRIGITQEEVDSPLTAPNFCMLLRKHLLSSTIEEISLVGFDRIVKIRLTPTSEFFDAKEKVLYCELMGRYSNIILTEDGKVLGGNRGINNFDNGIRPIIVGLPYVFPPTNTKKEPNDSTLIEYFSGYDRCKSLAEYTINGVQGLALSTAKEIENAYFVKDKNFDNKTYFNFINDFIQNTKVEPCIFYENGKIKDICVYKYALISGDVKHFNSIREAEDFFFAEREKEKKYRDRLDKLTACISAAIKKSKKKLVAILSREKDAQKKEDYRIKGELIIANIYKIKQGDEKVLLDNYYDNTKIEVELDKNLSPSKNAESYYKKYNKSKRALSMLLPQKEMAEKELEYLESISDELSFAYSIEDLRFLREELEDAGLLKVQNINDRRKIKKVNGYREYDIKGYTVKAGRNNIENDKLYHSAKPEDIWVHAKDYHSSHIIIERHGDKEIPLSIILTAAEICAFYSKGNGGGKIEIVYTNKKHVKKPPKANLGFCTYTDFKSVLVEPISHEQLIK